MNTSDTLVCVLGLGYIGLPTASLLASKGFRVVGVDVSENVVTTINRGDIHIVEPGLDLLVKAAVHSGRLTAALAPVEADIFIIAVPTPFKDGKEPDLKYVVSAAESIARVAKSGDLVILESTCPPATTDEIVCKALLDRGVPVGDGVHLAYCPERVLPGRILTELVENDRVVGGIDDASTEVAASFYGTFVDGQVLKTNARTAEMVKLVENSFRDVNIAFANEVSILADQEGVDVWSVIDLANRHPRVDILSPGPGVGGHCIAVDPWFLVHRSPADARLIGCARSVNDAKPGWVVDKIMDAVLGKPRQTVACLGLAFKPNVDDLRESPALGVVHSLLAADVADVLVVEPNIDQHASLKLVSAEEAMDSADIVVALVAHDEFKRIDFSDVTLIDVCGLLRNA